ncbi:TonB-dependent receptor [Belnapia sp. T18]|uniref:TonB-dependent receptor n=1 Tax=Belnapia arida TaxID=2804533 RepID=A0ABS1UCZ7_9PROT|nr:TonB-dependent receptor [Belnapia arida]
MQQVGQQSSRGVKLAGAGDLGRGVRININGTAVSYAGKVPVQVPQVSAKLWMSWNFAPGWEAQGGVRFAGQAYTDYANTQTRPGYTVVSLGFNWQPHPALGFSARLQNAFDETYATIYYDGGYLLAPPLTAHFAMRVGF